MIRDRALRVTQAAPNLHLLRRLGGVVVSRAAGSLGNFLLLIFAARLFGAAAAGLHFSSVAIGYVSAHLFSLGLSRYILRNMSQCRDDATLANQLQQLIVMVSALLIGLVLFLAGAAALLGISFPLKTPFVLGGLIGAFLLFQLLNADMLKSAGRPETAILVEISLFPWFALFILFVAKLAGVGIASVPAVATLAGTMIVSLLIVCFLATNSYIESLSRPISPALARLRSASPRLAVYWMSGMAVIVAARLPALTAPLFGTADEVGYLAVALGIASLGGTIIHAAQAYYAPRFARLAAEGFQTGALVRAILSSQIVCFSLFLVVALPCLLAPGTVLAVVGEEFERFDPDLLVMMVVAQLIRTTGGCSEIFLSMVDWGRAETISLLIGIGAFAVILFFGNAETGIALIALAYSAMLVVRGLVPTALCYVRLARR